MSKAIVTTIVCCLVSSVTIFSGCQRPSMTEQRNKARQYSRIAELHRQMMIEDVDKYLMLDRPTRLSPWLVLSR